MRRESRERVAPTTTTTGDDVATSTGDHASHLHHQYPTPSLLFSNPLSLSRADSPGHRRRGQCSPPPTTATTTGFWAVRRYPHHEGEVATHRFKAQTRSEVPGKWGVRHGKFREVVPRATAAAVACIGTVTTATESLQTYPWLIRNKYHATVKDSSAAES